VKVSGVVHRLMLTAAWLGAACSSPGDTPADGGGDGTDTGAVDTTTTDDPSSADGTPGTDDSGSADDGTIKLDVAPSCDCGVVDGCCDPSCGSPDLDCTAQCDQSEIRDVGPLSLPVGAAGPNAHVRLDDGYAVVTYAGTGRVTWAMTDDEGVVDPTTIGELPGYHPHIAASGDSLLVTYAAGSDLWTNAQLRAARIDTDGTLLSDDVVVPEPGHLQNIEAAWHPASEQWGVLWEFAPGGTSRRVRFARLDAQGALVPGSLLDLNDPIDLAQLGDAASLVATSDGFSLILERSDTIELRRLDLEGNEIVRSELPTQSQPFNSTIAPGVDSYGVAWQDSPTQVGFVVHFVRADGDGTLLPETQVTWGLEDLDIGNPSVAWDGSRYHVVWLAEDAVGSIQLLHGEPSGDTLPGQLVTFGSKHAWWPRALWDGCALVVAYSDWDPDGFADEAAHLLFIPGPVLTPEG